MSLESVSLKKLSYRFANQQRFKSKVLNTQKQYKYTEWLTQVIYTIKYLSIGMNGLLTQTIANYLR